MKQEKYRSQLLDCSWHPGEEVLRNDTPGTSKNGQVNHLQPPVEAVFDFLSKLFDKGLTYSAINCARSALSSYVSLDDGSVVGQNPLVCRLLKGVFQSRPPKPKYTEVWDVQVVLTYLATLHPVQSLQLKQLTSELVMLLLLASYQASEARLFIC